MKDTIEIWEDEPRAGTSLIAKGFDREHKVVLRLIRDYEKDFLHFGIFKTRKLKSTGGRAANEILLNEDQAMFLGSLLRNNEKVVAFKRLLIDKFKECRLKLAALQKNKENPKLLETRNAGKIVRRNTTDAMQEFVDYAKSQGSGSPDRYYGNITKMMNGLLFIVDGKFKVLRDVMSIHQLMTVSSAEQIIDRGLRDGMSKKRYYKDIYQDVKKRVLTFAELHGQSHVIEKQLLE